MRPFACRSDDWIFGALLAAVLGSGVGLNGAWVHEARVARAAAAASAAASASAMPAHVDAQAAPRASGTSLLAAAAAAHVMR